MNNNNAIHADNGNTNMMKLQAKPMMIDVIRSMTVQLTITKSDGPLANKINDLVSIKPCTINDIANELTMSRSAIQAKINELKAKFNTTLENVNGRESLIVRAVGLVMEYVPTGIQAKDLTWKKQ